MSGTDKSLSDGLLAISLSEQDVERFRQYLKREPSTGCLIWIGHRISKGYGHFSIGSRIDNSRTAVLSHRVAFILGGGILTPEKPRVLHLCDNPPCCEFTHLAAGSISDNSADMARKNRGSKSRSGLPYGVLRKRERFGVQIRVDGRLRQFRTYSTAEEAGRVAARMKEEIYRAREAKE